ncbi:hypothetical protein JVX90_15880 [Gordonia sp. PDNC005]|uniref:hypothetical protein n=1 Tax=unclassified Gordonia (in: high G+C Gram-positive bacteria) TaxID=2657482 RepID=UPI001963EFEB|nr:hypothetical protein [Gordonia sp. PDNC005]QRY61870.1 hypothetical protein JVX90_15880 [Gordonia sp. PDNC005]
MTDSPSTPASALYGTPIRTSDHVTVIPVSMPATRFRPSRALGVFVVTDDGDTTWRSAVDDTRIAQLGITVGLVATIMSLAAVIRRPPWPDLRREDL